MAHGRLLAGLWSSSVSKRIALIRPAAERCPWRGAGFRIRDQLHGIVDACRGLNVATTTARQLYDAMLELYPNHVNPGSLWGAANTAKKHP